MRKKFLWEVTSSPAVGDWTADCSDGSALQAPGRGRGCNETVIISSFARGVRQAKRLN
ncbi:hypothetical protein ACP4J5_11115 [Pseudomonas oryzihabitans]|uniref:hypothetical protein n=1 Tax=Pseudomonas oryzihabitans TaxID=47885 RepID=UPI003CF33668